MKRYTECLLLTFLILNFFEIHAQSLTVREIEGKEKPQFANRAIYDTLNNIKYHENPDDYKMYIGQKILFYPRSKDATSDILFYGNFKLTQLDTLYNIPPDTLWIRKRKNIKPQDYRLEYKVSEIYKPQYVEEKKVCFGSVHKSLKTGLYTPYNKIEGKIFKIENCEVRSSSSYFSNDTIFFTLIDEEGTRLTWETQNLNNFSAFPAVVVAYYEKIKDLYVGKDFFPIDIDNSYKSKRYFLKNIKKGGKYTEVIDMISCIEISLVGEGNNYLLPTLIFKDKDGELLFMNIIVSPPSLRYLEGWSGPNIENSRYLFGDVFTDTKVHSGEVAQMQDLIVSDEIYNRRKVKEEEFLAKEKLAQERLEKEKIEKENRYKRIYAKYKNKDIAKMIVEGYVRRGMTKQMCIDSWGEPSDINKSIGSWGTHEQWVYGSSSYLYFENGILTSIQN